jgi:hypothetical protein
MNCKGTSAKVPHGNASTKQTGVRNQVELLMELIEEVELGNYDEKLKATDSASWPRP